MPPEPPIQKIRWVIGQGFKNKVEDLRLKFSSRLCDAGGIFAPTRDEKVGSDRSRSRPQQSALSSGRSDTESRFSPIVVNFVKKAKNLPPTANTEVVSEREMGLVAKNGLHGRVDLSQSLPEFFHTSLHVCLQPLGCVWAW